jgi:hypothetical protein
MHVSDNAVTGKHFRQNPPSFAAGRQSQKANAWVIAQSGIGLFLVKEGTVEEVGIETQRDFANVKTLRIGVVTVYADQK